MKIQKEWGYSFLVFNIRQALGEIRCCVMDCRALVNTQMNFSGSIKCWAFL
jgi:hypothetical protein